MRLWCLECCPSYIYSQHFIWLSSRNYFINNIRKALRCENYWEGWEISNFLQSLHHNNVLHHYSNKEWRRAYPCSPMTAVILWRQLNLENLMAFCSIRCPTNKTYLPSPNATQIYLYVLNKNHSNNHSHKCHTNPSSCIYFNIGYAKSSAKNSNFGNLWLCSKAELLAPSSLI